MPHPNPGPQPNAHPNPNPCPNRNPNRIGTEESWDFYDVHDRHKARDMEILRAFRTRSDSEQYTLLLREVLRLFGEGTHHL